MLFRSETGHADPDGVVVTKRRQQCTQRVGELIGVWCGHPLARNDLVVFVEEYRETFRPADVDAGASCHDSMRALSSFNVLKIRTSARRFTKPGSGMINSIDRS